MSRRVLKTFASHQGVLGGDARGSAVVLGHEVRRGVRIGPVEIAHGPGDLPSSFGDPAQLAMRAVVFPRFSSIGISPTTINKSRDTARSGAETTIASCTAMTSYERHNRTQSNFHTTIRYRNKQQPLSNEAAIW